MYSLDSPYPSPPRMPPEPPHDDLPPVSDGVDPAALIAARTEAVARTRRQNARIALVQDILRIIGVAVLIGGIAWFVHQRHQQNMEEERRKAEREMAEQAARAKERADEAARLAAQRKEQMEIRKKAEEEQRRRLEERRRAAEQKAEAARAKSANVKRYQAALDRLNGSMLALLSAAPPSDLPAKVVNETWFTCLVPGGRTGVMLYEILAIPGQRIKASRLDAEGTVEDISFEEFSRQVAKSPYLLSKGSYCYYSPAGAGRWELRVPVLADGESLDPGREDFRDLYNVVRRRGIIASSFTYDVFFRDFGGAETRLFSVPFGDKVTRSSVQRSLQSAAGSQRQHDGGAALRARMNQGSLVIRRGGRR